MWEDWRFGFYDNCSGKVKQEKIDKALEMFNSEELTIQYMNKVIEEWKYSCEHNLTNEALNRIAYIGQAACCLYAEVPSTITMEAWNLLSKDVQNRSDNIAKEVINKWLYNNRLVQLCLNMN
jgi:hypothetical protein